MVVQHLPPLANLAAGSLLFGQFLSARPYSVGLAMSGIAMWAFCFGIAYMIAAKE